MLYAGPQPDVLGLTFLIAFIPSLILMVVLRYTEKYEREPWGALGTAFLWGATATVVLVILARGFFQVYMKDKYPDIASDKEMMIIYTTWLITPIAAEILKLMSLFFVREELDEAEDGLIYGAVAGLGFAATEMMLYGIFVFSSYGITVFIHTVLLRTVSVVMLQASVGAIAGYGISRAVAKKHKKGKLWLSPVFLIVAIAIHGLFNAIANSTQGGGGFNISYTYALFFAIAVSVITWFIIWVKIIRLDRSDDNENKKKDPKKDGQADRFSFKRPEDRGVGSGLGSGFDAPVRRPRAVAAGAGAGGRGADYNSRDSGYDDGYDDEYYDDGYDDDEYYDEDYDDDEYDDEGYDDEYYDD